MRLIWYAFVLTTMVDAFHPPLFQPVKTHRHLTSFCPTATRVSVQLPLRLDDNDNDDDADSRREQRRKRRYEDDQTEFDDEFEDDDEYDDEEEDEKRQEKRGFFDFLFGDDDDDDEDEYEYEYDDDDDDEEYDGGDDYQKYSRRDNDSKDSEEWDLFDGPSSKSGNAERVQYKSRATYDPDFLVSNPLLDAVDPEDTSDRFGQLFSDGMFWRDVALVAIAWFALDVISYNSVPDVNMDGLHVPYPQGTAPIDWSTVDVDATLRNLNAGQ